MERRRYGRMGMMAELRHAADGEAGAAITKRVTDLSEGGLFIDTPVPAAVGTLLSLRFDLDGRSVEAEGRVAFAQAFIGMGIEFTRVAPEVAEAIRVAVGAREPALV